VTRAWSQLRALNQCDRLLVREAAIVLILVWAGLGLLSFSSLRRLLDRYARARVSPDRARPALDRIGWAVTAVARRSPVPMTCLRQALAADAMLRRHGFASRLRLGVQLHPRPSSTSLQSHAWVECDGTIVVGGLEDLADYAVLAAPGGP
jgi:hypothetical protein